MVRVDVEKRVKDAVARMEGIQKIRFDDEKTSICFLDFDSSSYMMKFVKNQKEIAEFKGLYANKEEGELVRDVNRALNKIKRAVCEVAGVEGKSVRFLRAPTSKVIWNQDGRIIEVAYVDCFGNINWADNVENAIRVYTKELLETKF